MNFEKPIRLVLLVFCLMGLWFNPVFSQQALQTDETYDPLKGHQEIKKLVKAFSRNAVSASELESIKKEISQHLQQGGKGQEIVQNELQQIDTALKALGEKVEGESEKIARERSGLAGKHKLKEAELAEYRLLVLNAGEALKKLEQYRQEGRRLKMLSQGMPLWEIAQDVRTLEAGDRFFNLSQAQKEISKLTGHQLGVILLGVFLAIWLSVRLLAKIEGVVGLARGSCLEVLLSRLTRRPLVFRIVFGVLAGATVSTWLMLSRDTTPPSYLPWLFLSLLVVTLLPTLVEALCLAGGGIYPGEMTFPRGQRWRIRLAATGAALLLFMLTSPNQGIVSEPLFLVFRAVMMFSACLLTVAAVHSTAGYFAFIRTKRTMLRSTLLVVTAVILYLEILGFRALSAYVLASIAGSFLLYAGTVLFLDIVKHLYTVLFRERRYFLEKIGIVPDDDEEEDDLLQGIGWLQGIMKLILVIVVGLLLIRIWDISNIYAAALLSFLLNGFHVGDLDIVPARIVLGILVFIVGWSAALWIKKILEQRLEPDPSFAASTREALLTVTGYVCYVLAAIVGLSVSGVSLTGLTVVAGALSVGIGFGLQNIVNNFVSGLILLFERPIKRGDWVVVGTTEGYVKKISVRSTIIQTFDRADVIVPNSELIASPVTNMMFNDARGRLRVSVGVAYGSDTDLVRRLLLEIANSQREVIVDGSSPQPEVFFQAFGDSSLNFDLLCHLKNIDNKYRIQSEINFMIDAAFRQHGVEIPFPQRDIHIKQNLQSELEMR